MAHVSAPQQICAGLTKSGERCKRKALPGERFCKLHAEAVQDETSASDHGDSDHFDDETAESEPAPSQRGGRPSDIDSSEFERIVSELTGGHGFPEVASIAGSAYEEMRGVASMAQAAIGRLMQIGTHHGIVHPGIWEQFASDAAQAAISIGSALADRASGDYEEDDFGFDPKFTEALLPAFNLLYSYWWRVTVEGIHNVPAEGRGLLVSNHAGGGLPFDGAMMKVALLKRDPKRHLRILVLDWLMGLPYMADMMRSTGQALACKENATMLLERDEVVAVFPEGVKGMVKPFSQRYQLARFGRGGFVRIALRTGSPIIPVAVVGSEEIYPKIGNIPFVHKLIGAPFVPMTPTFPLLGLAGLVPLPSKWHIEFCDPIDVSQFGPDAADDRAFVLELSEQIRATIQERLQANLLKRSTPFW
jgi:1-acyl-sn-glycerol-3-phosphate acyltransferase